MTFWFLLKWDLSAHLTSFNMCKTFQKSNIQDQFGFSKQLFWNEQNIFLAAATFAFWTSGVIPCHHFHGNLLQTGCSQSLAVLSETGNKLYINIKKMIGLGIIKSLTELTTRIGILLKCNFSVDCARLFQLEAYICNYFVTYNALQKWQHPFRISTFWNVTTTHFQVYYLCLIAQHKV